MARDNDFCTITVKRCADGYDYWIRGHDDRLLASGWAKGGHSAVWKVAVEHARERGLTIDG